MYTLQSNGPNLTHQVIQGVSSESWTSVAFGKTYQSPVVIGTPVLRESGHSTTVVRVRNVTTTGCEIKVQKANTYTPEIFRDVHLITVEEGVYTAATHGVTMEAARFTSTVTDYKGNWNGEARSYANSYTTPVVLGQVMSHNDSAFSVFWARGVTRNDLPDGQTLFVGKHVGEDPNNQRVDEEIGYIVIEASNGLISGKPYQAGITADIIRGPGNSSAGYSAPINLPTADVAVLSATMMDGNDGGWPVLFGETTHLTDTEIRLVFDEDTLRDSERRHITEVVSFFVVGE